MERNFLKNAPKLRGALIGEGPDDWRILQRQPDGTAELHLAGTWSHDGPATRPVVKVRAVLEDTGESILPWTDSDMDGGNWSYRGRLPEGGPYRIETCLSMDEQKQVEWSVRGDMVHHVGVGDVFAIAGQSNSAGYGKDPVYDPAEVGVHLLANDGRWRLATHPMNESTNTVHHANLEGGNPGHAPWLAFAKRLRRELGVPVGLVQSALGGSPLSEWNPEETGGLYRNLMAILAPLRAETKDPRLLAGVLWYQGCSDTGEGTCDTYLDRFARFVARLREDLADPALPFLTVQIGRFTAKAEPGSDAGWSKVREAQRRAAHEIPGVAVVPTLDLPLSDAIHIASSGNLVLGDRAAKAVLGAFYGIGQGFRAPEPDCAVLEGGNRVRVHFANVVERLYDWEVVPALVPFCVETPDGIELAPARIDYVQRSDVVLTFDRDLPPGCVVHGAHQQNPPPLVPHDVTTRLPMLSFYGLPVEG